GDVQDRVVVARLAVGRDDLAALLPRHGDSLPRCQRGPMVSEGQQRQGFSQSNGCTGVPFTRTSKCRWSPVDAPVVPTRPIRSPWCTCCPTCTRIADWCP